MVPYTTIVQDITFLVSRTLGSLARLFLVVSEWRTTLLQAPFRSGSQESEITLLIYYHLKPFSSSGFSTSSLWYSINWFTGVGGSFVKHITRYKPAIITTPKNREVLVTVAYSDSHSNRQIHHLLGTKLPCTFPSESQKLRQVFFYKIMQWHRLKHWWHAQVMLLTWKRIQTS